MSERRLGLKPVAVLVAVFALGAAAGGAATWALAVRELDATMRRPPDQARLKLRLDAMRRHLDLSDEQVARLEVIFEAAARDKDAALGKCRPELDAVRGRIGAQIDEVLTPEQQVKHRAMKEERRERFGDRGQGSAAPASSEAP